MNSKQLYVEEVLGLELVAQYYAYPRMYISSKEWLIRHKKRKLPYFFNETPILFKKWTWSSPFFSSECLFLKEAAFEKYNKNK